MLTPMHIICGIACLAGVGGISIYSVAKKATEYNLFVHLTLLAALALGIMYMFNLLSR